MKLTCVTPVFNAIKAGRRDALVRCVRSVAQLGCAHEHLVYDGVSTDGTVAALRELERSTPGLSVVSEQDTGIYNALNKGVRDAKGDWLYVLGCDDEIASPKELEAAIAAGDRTGAEVVLAPVFLDEQRTQLRRMFDGYVFCFMPYPHQGMLMRTALVRRLGGFDERYRISSDYDLILRAMRMGTRMVHRKSAYAIYGLTGVSSNDDVRRVEERKIVRSLLDLSETEAKNLSECRRLPRRVFFRYCFHPSVELRYTVWRHAIWGVFRALGLLTNEGLLKVRHP